jgi:26S proteasome regulatory subunit N7
MAPLPPKPVVEIEDPLKEQWYLETAQDLFSLTYRGNKSPAATKAKILATAKERNAAPIYRALCEASDEMPDASLLKAMEEATAAELKKIDDELANATENEGESEIRAALYARARVLMLIADKPAALAAFDKTYAKTVPIGQKLDVVFCKLRIGLYDLDHALLKESFAKAKELLDQGGDWERRNRLKVYESLHLIAIRQFDEAAQLLLDSVATFTATEVCSYERFICYVVLTAQLSLDRPTLKSKVIDAPEILAVIGQLPFLKSFLNSLYARGPSCGLERERALAAVHTGGRVASPGAEARGGGLRTGGRVGLDSLARDF